MEGGEAAERIAAEAIVLLKNEDSVLPFVEGQKTAFFGRAQIDTVYSGNGSGAAHSTGCRNILEECEKRGIRPEPGLKAYYREQVSGEEKSIWDEIDWTNADKMANSGIMYEIFGRYHGPVKECRISGEQLEQAAGYTDTAVLVIGRNSGGEECDRHPEGDYSLTDSEEELAAQVCRSFEKVVLVLNVNGLIDLSWTERYGSIKGILFLGVPGQEGASALADILTGRVNPSGKLAFTIARQYGDYPAAPYFSWDKDNADSLLTYENYGLDGEENGSRGFAKSPVTLYWEDIYAGYRYFDTFQKEPLYPFGHGLSYTAFRMDGFEAIKREEGIEVGLRVKNTGSRAGREVAQLYLAYRGSACEHALQELKGFGKTKLLKPGEEQRLCLRVPWREWACYEEERAAWIILQGEYHVLIGNSSRNTAEAVTVRVEEDILLQQCRNRLSIRECNRGRIKLLSRLGHTEGGEVSPKAFQTASETGNGSTDTGGSNLETNFSGSETIHVRAGDVKTDTPCSISDEGKRKAVVRHLSIEQLAALCVGYGPGIPFSAFGDRTDPETIYDGDGRPLTVNSHPTGRNGYVSPAIPEEGIHSVSYQDGPAGIGSIAWPTGMLVACAFDKETWTAFGDAVGAECERLQVDVWLAPAVNLQRHPLGGRNFEYFSEDPYLTGICASQIARGVQENHPVLVCPKHFALNEQETFRRGNTKKNYDAADSIVSERAARELYLKPFEMLVREAGIACLMTSFNKINGVFAGGNADLCTHILREEWGYRGVVVTDWGDMDVVVDGADAVAAGNDIVMPGGPPVITQILKGYEEGRISREDLERAVSRLLYMSGRTVR